MTPADLERLAEACEDAAEDQRIEAGMVNTRPHAKALLIETAEILEAHARAIRAGRVTVTEEGGV
jgi:hypothetical protein